MKNQALIAIISGAALTAGIVACTEKYEAMVSEESPGLTTVVTYAPEKVTMNSADLKGSVEMDINGVVYETGIYLYSPGSVSNDSTGMPEYMPTDVAESEEKILSSSLSPGEFNVFLTGLTPNTLYRYRAFVTNGAGTFIGPEMTLVTSYGTVKDAEGNLYQTIKVGEQLWMRENLRTTVYYDGSCIDGCYMMTDDPEYGKRYSWTAANKASNGPKGYFTVDPGGACPAGWHIPDDDEWQVLLSYTGISAEQFSSDPGEAELIGYDQAGMLKDAGAAYWNNDRISNRTGFSVLPARICSANGNPACVTTAFWTSTPNIFYGFQSESNRIVRGNNPSVSCGFSVRCIKNRN